jgi:CBS domain containing-hemolysin-like protein
VVAGTVRLEEIGERLGVDLEHEEVETVGGLVLSLLERPPEPGDIVIYQEIQIEVTAIEGHGVRTCVITRIHSHSDENGDGISSP